MENKYKQYDDVINIIMTNILIEKERCDKFILYSFHPDNGANKLYFNVAAIAADMSREKMFLEMSLIDYFKFKRGRGRKQKNVRWFGLWRKKDKDEKNRVDIDVIMDYIQTQLKLDDNLFEEINNEYYGWIK